MEHLPTSIPQLVAQHSPHPKLTTPQHVSLYLTRKVLIQEAWRTKPAGLINNLQVKGGRRIACFLTVPDTFPNCKWHINIWSNPLQFSGKHIQVYQKIHTGGWPWIIHLLRWGNRIKMGCTKHRGNRNNRAYTENWIQVCLRHFCSFSHISLIFWPQH